MNHVPPTLTDFARRLFVHEAGRGQRTEHEVAASFMIEHGLEPLEQWQRRLQVVS